MFAANRYDVQRDIVPGLIRPGLSLLAGEDGGPAPGLTPSGLAVQLAAAVAGGCRGQVAGLQGGVLYLAQAERMAFLQEQLYALRVPERLPGDLPGDLPLTFSLYNPPLDTGGIDYLARTVGAPGEAGRGSHRLVVVDPLARAISSLARYGPSRLLRTLEQLRVLALTHDLAVLLVDVRRKEPSATFDAALGEAHRRSLFDRTLTLVRREGKGPGNKAGKNAGRPYAELILSDSPRPLRLPYGLGQSAGGIA